MPKRSVGRAAFPIVVSGPSGVGKSTICRRILSEDPLTAYSVSVTTRPLRGSEKEGEHYTFVDDPGFDALTNAGELAEWAEVHGHRYGTRRSVIEEVITTGRDVVMDVDVQGGTSIKRIFPESVLLFILPPSHEVLEQRLRARATDDEKVIATRLANALEELTWAPKYDYLVVNDDLDTAVDEAKTIIRAERLRASRTEVGSILQRT